MAANIITNVAQYGFNTATLITNGSCLFGMSSGVGAINPEVFIRAKVVKSDMVVVHYDRLPMSLRQHFEAGKGRDYGMAEFYTWLAGQISERIAEGRVFSFGEIILGLKVPGRINKVFLRHKSFNQPLRVVGYKDTNPFKGGKGMYKSDTIKLTVYYEMEVVSQWWKLRNDGVKFTTLPTHVSFYDMEGNPVDIHWDLMLPMEAIKGKLATLIAYATRHGGGEVSLKEGTITMNSGEVIDLLDPQSKVYEWMKGGAVRDVWVQFVMARAEWDVMIEARGQHNDLMVVEINERAVIVRERIQVLEADLVYEVEVSTPRENCNWTALTLETGASIALQSREVAEALNREAQVSRNAVKGLVEMLTSSPEGAEVMDIGKASVRQMLAELIGPVQELSDSQIVDKYKELFPHGVVFKAMSTNGIEKREVHLNFDTIRGMTTFIGGSAEGVSEDIVTFLCWLNAPGESGVDSKVYSKISQLRASLEGWGMTMLESKSIFKRMARLGGAVAMKVRTAPWAMLNHRKGELPKVALNPDDDMVKLLCQNNTGEYLTRYCEVIGEGEKMRFVFNPWKLAGEVITVGRAPMVMQTACEVVLTEAVDIGHCVVLPHVWAYTTEGDSDGDGIYTINLSGRGISHEAAITMNNSLMSVYGYRIAYGTDPKLYPCAEFVSYKDKWTKKCLVYWDKEVEAKYLTAYIGEMPKEKYLWYGKRVPAHYRSAVGVAYNICVVLTHKAVNLQYEIWAGSGNQNRLVLLMSAMAVAWRLLYEGLGLGGFTPEATRFFTILRIAAFSDTFVHRTVDGEDSVPCSPNKQDPPSSHKSCLEALIYLGNDLSKEGGIVHLDRDDSRHVLSKGIMAEIVKACRISFNWGAIERGNPRVQYMTRVEYDEAVLYGCLRRAGQGYDPAGQRSLSAMDREDVEYDEDGEAVLPESLMALALRLDISRYESCPWIAQVIQEAASTHVKANELIYYARKQNVDI